MYGVPVMFLYMIYVYIMYCLRLIKHTYCLKLCSETIQMLYLWLSAMHSALNAQKVQCTMPYRIFLLHLSIHCLAFSRTPFSRNKIEKQQILLLLVIDV